MRPISGIPTRGPLTIPTPKIETNPSEPDGLFGQTIPIGTGRRRVKCAALWSSPIRTITTTEADGTVTIKRLVDVALSLGISTERTRLLRLWAGEQAVYDRVSTPPVRLRGVSFRTYPGGNAQTPDPTIIAAVGADNAPAFRDLAYVVIRNFPLHQFGLTSLPAFDAEIASSASELNAFKEFTLSSSGITTEATSFQSVYDARRGRLISLHLSGGVTTIRVFDTKTHTEISQAPVRLFGQHIQFGEYNEVHLDDETGFVLAMCVATQRMGWCNPLSGEISGYVSDSVGTPGYVSLLPRTSNYAPFTNNGNQFFGEYTPTGYVVLNAGIRRDGNPETYHKEAILINWVLNQMYQVQWEFNATTNQYRYCSRRQITLPGSGNVRGLAFSTVGWQVGKEDPASFVQEPGTAAPISNGSLRYNVMVPKYGALQARLTYFTRGGVLYEMFWAAPVTESLSTFGVAIPPTIRAVGSLTGSETVRHIWADPNLPYVYIVRGDDNTGVWKVDRYIATPVEASRGWATPGTNIYTWPPTAQLTYADTLELPQGSAPSVYHSESYFNNSGFFAYEGTSGEYNNNLVIVDLPSMTFEGIPIQVSSFNIDDPEDIRAYSDFGDNYRFDAATFSILTTRDSVFSDPTRIYLDGALAQKILLSDVIRWLALEAGFENSEITITNIDDPVYGGYLDRESKFADVMNNLAQAFGFDWYENAGRFVAIRRLPGSTPDAEFDIEDLIEVEDDKYLSTTLIDPADLPASIKLGYYDPEVDFKRAYQTASRALFPYVEVTRGAENSYDTVVVMDAVDAKNAAIRSLYTATAGSMFQAFATTQEHLLLEPTDLVRITLGQYTYFIKLEEATINADFSISFAGRNFSSEFDATVEVDPPVQPPETADSDFQLLIFDLALKDTPEITIFVQGVAISNGPVANWAGASVSYQPANANYDLLDDGSTDFTWFQVTNRPEDNNHSFALDRDNELVVIAGNGDIDDLVTVTEEEMLAGANVCLYGRTGRWEIIAFTTATVDGDTVTLGNLMRGIRGTEHNVNNHEVNDILIPLPALVPTRSLPASYSDTVTLFKGQSNEDPANFLTRQINMRPWHLMPLAPVNVRCSREVDDDLVLTWNRQDRYLHEIEDGSTPTPNSETSEAYEIDILDADGIVIRTLEAATETVTYSAADQTTDGFTLSETSLSVRVYQLSDEVGRGYPKEVTVDVE